MSGLPDALREPLARALAWEEAHVGFEEAVGGIPADARGARPAGFEHSPWQLLEHMRIAQDDILEFCLNPAYTHQRAWPADYWPQAAAPPHAAAWDQSVAAFTRAREQMAALAHDTADLLAKVPTGKDNQTYLRAILLIIDHNAYHIGQLVALRRALGIWK